MRCAAMGIGGTLSHLGWAYWPLQARRSALDGERELGEEHMQSLSYPNFLTPHWASGR